MMTVLKRSSIAVLLGACVSFAGCHTVEGMRKDLEEAGTAVEAWQQGAADAIDEALYSDD